MKTTRKSSLTMVRRLVMSAALVLSAKAAKDDLRVCDYETDLQVEFSECDPFGETRNGKILASVDVNAY